MCLWRIKSWYDVEKNLISKTTWSTKFNFDLIKNWYVLQFKKVILLNITMRSHVLQSWYDNHLYQDSVIFIHNTYDDLYNDNYVQKINAKPCVDIRFIMW